MRDLEIAHAPFFAAIPSVLSTLGVPHLHSRAYPSGRFVREDGKWPQKKALRRRKAL
jgi:hypothetical protein